MPNRLRDIAQAGVNTGVQTVTGPLNALRFAYEQLPDRAQLNALAGELRKDKNDPLPRARPTAFAMFPQAAELLASAAVNLPYGVSDYMNALDEVGRQPVGDFSGVDDETMLTAILGGPAAGSAANALASARRGAVARPVSSEIPLHPAGRQGFESRPISAERSRQVGLGERALTPGDLAEVAAERTVRADQEKAIRSAMDGGAPVRVVRNEAHNRKAPVFDVLVGDQRVAIVAGNARGKELTDVAISGLGPNALGPGRTRQIARAFKKQTGFKLLSGERQTGARSSAKDRQTSITLNANAPSKSGAALGLAERAMSADTQVPVRAFHGTKNTTFLADGEAFHPGSHFGTSRVANQFAKDGAVAPVDLEMNNPLRVRYASGDHDPLVVTRQIDRAIPGANTASKLRSHIKEKYRDRFEGVEPGTRQEDKRVHDVLRDPEALRDLYKHVGKQLSDLGHDGIVYKNSVDDAGADSFIATQPNTVKSSITGETLFANPANAAPAAAVATVDPFDEELQTLSDLIGAR